MESESDKNATNRRNSNDRIVSPAATKPYSPNSSAMQYYKNSAFRPVFGHRAQLFNENVFNSSILGSTASTASGNPIDDSAASNFNNDNE